MIDARKILTTIWLVAFAGAVVIVEAYFFRTTHDGIPLLLPGDRPQVYTTIGLLYGATLAAILAGWFVKPFPAPPNTTQTRYLLKLALALTLGYNLMLWFLLAQGHSSQMDGIDSILDRTKTIGGVLAFLVAPVNFYYFGIKRAE